MLGRDGRARDREAYPTDLSVVRGPCHAAPHTATGLIVHLDLACAARGSHRALDHLSALEAPAVEEQKYVS